MFEDFYNFLCHRATEKNSEIARNLEDEMEEQVIALETKIREEEKRKAEQEKNEVAWQLHHAAEQLKEMENKVKQVRLLIQFFCI